MHSFTPLLPHIHDAHVVIFVFVEVIKNLDGIWDETEELEQSLELSASIRTHLSTCLESALFHHQEQAIQWMCRKECAPDGDGDGDGTAELPPFYSVEEGAGRTRTYLHSLTRHSYKTKPQNVRGGLLCDEMGLGE